MRELTDSDEVVDAPSCLPLVTVAGEGRRAAGLGRLVVHGSGNLLCRAPGGCNLAGVSSYSFLVT